MRSCCQVIDNHFEATKAADQARDFDQNGPPKETRLLVEALTSADVHGLRVLDVGAGLGVVADQLLQAGAAKATLVDISRAYLAAARQRLDASGVGERAELLHGDLAGLANVIGQADVVTLDKVICCYPDMPALVQESVHKAARFWAASYPRERVFVWAMFWFENALRKLRGNPFRTFVHPVRAIEAQLNANGFVLRSARHTPIWRVALFERRGEPAG